MLGALLWVLRGFSTWIFALRAVFNVNVRQLAVNERQCFLCGLWWTMFVNGVLRTLWVGFNDTEPDGVLCSLFPC